MAVRRFFVDVHRTANKKRKNKTDENLYNYTTDGENFGKVRTLTEIPAEAGEELYVDTTPIELTEELLALLKGGVRVFYLRRPTMLERKRDDEVGLSKTSRNDLRIMMALQPKWFIEIDEGFLVIRRLCASFRNPSRTRFSLMNRTKALEYIERSYDRLYQVVEESMNKAAMLIVAEA